MALPRAGGTKCYRLCTGSSTTSECSNLQGNDPNYVCIGLVDMRYGACLGVGESCDPLDDACAADEVCSLRGGQPFCVPAGVTEVGGDCSEEPCEKGMTCINLEGAPGRRCFKPCDPSIPTCQGGGGICTSLSGYAFGICQEPNVACDPLTNDCPAGKNCSIVGLDVKCVDAGATALAGDCSSEPCDAGVCAQLPPESIPTCHEPCDMILPLCTNTGMTCMDIGMPFGLCS